MLTASIVTHKTNREQLQKALRCLLQSDVDRIFIIDNSPDDSLRHFYHGNPRITYRHVENRGFGAGHNIAMREILSYDDDRIESNRKHGDSCFHLVMNADVCWEGDVLTPLVAYLKDNPDVGMVMPKVYYPDGALQYTCRMLPTPLDLFAKRFLPKRIIEKRMERYLLAGHDHDKPLNCPYLLGSFLLFRNDALRECGLFDERFFMYPEDIDITRRLHRKWRTMYWPRVSIIHEHAAASRKDKKMLKIHISNMIRYFNKWGWLIDPERRRFNCRLRESIVPVSSSSRSPARG